MFDNVILVNNSGSDIRDFEVVIINAIKSGEGLPEELADLFTLDVIEANGKARGILNAA